MKIVTVVGARPQFIKAAVVSRAVSEYNIMRKNEIIKEIIIHTGQHYDANMSEVFFSEMHIPAPAYNLGIHMGSHGAMTGQMLEKIEDVLILEKPDAVIVYGDTNSTLAGALAAVKLHIPVAHVEAGLRSFNMQMPEEINRIITDRISQWLFCPSDTAMKNLQREGFIIEDNNKSPNYYNVGDVMYDAILFYKNIAKKKSNINQVIQNTHSDFYLATVHRAENTNNTQRLKEILRALNDISNDTIVIFPVHPRTEKLIDKLKHKNICFINPVGYFDMINLLDKCRAVLTDSGGVQKEAYFLNKPCLTLRDETEWVELIECGVNILVGANYKKIREAERVINNKSFNYSSKLYGNGDAGQRIVDILANKLNNM